MKLKEEQKEKLNQLLSIPKVESPFHHESSLNPYELLKLLIGIVLIPLKVVIITLSVFTSIFFCIIANFFDNPDKPHSFIHKLFSPILWISIRIILFCYGYFYISVKGKKVKYNEAPVIIGAPHSFFLDPFLTFYLYGTFSGFAKKELTSNFVFKVYGNFARTVWVDRTTADGKEKALETYKERVASALNGQKWPRFVTFPEGTCTNRKSLIQFKRGAFTPGAPIQAVLIRWKYFFFNPIWSSAGPNRNLMIFRTLSQFCNFVELEILPPYHPSEEEKLDPILFANNMSNHVAKKLGVSVTQHSYDDSFIGRKAAKLGFRKDIKRIFDFEFSSLKQLGLEFDSQEVFSLMEIFKKGSIKRNGQIGPWLTFQDVSKVLNVETGLEEFYKLIKNKDVEGISLKNFIIGVLFYINNLEQEKYRKIIMVEVLGEEYEKEEKTYSVEFIKEKKEVFEKFFGKIKSEDSLLNKIARKGKQTFKKKDLETYLNNNKYVYIKLELENNPTSQTLSV
eukprot:snap_masked-scaffold_9-processed-gene-8.34-mRNA-1 protein AED:1.00 eAED:1.00 QI:0/-1/0/0/-1/1/1/0/507